MSIKCICWVVTRTLKNRVRRFRRCSALHAKPEALTFVGVFRALNPIIHRLGGVKCTVVRNYTLLRCQDRVRKIRRTAETIFGAVNPDKHGMEKNIESTLQEFNQSRDTGSSGKPVLSAEWVLQ
jgi:hypothetical protein